MLSQAGVNFVFGTTGGDREKLMKVTADSGVYAVIVPQMKLLRARRFGSDGSGRGGCYREFPNEEGRDTEVGDEVRWVCLSASAYMGSLT